jgi:hypothetical protein
MSRSEIGAGNRSVPNSYLVFSQSKGVDFHSVSLKSHFMVVIGFVLCCGLLSCYYVQSQEGVVGEYALDRDGNRIVLDVIAGGTFMETITLKSGEVVKQTGTWTFAKPNSNLSFDSLWIPREFAPDYIVRVDDNSTGQPKYTHSGHWILTPQWRWGRVVMDVFPDDDVAFKKVR